MLYTIYGVSYKIRKTNSGSYSIDKYEKGEFKETISQNNLFEESNEEELNFFCEEIIKRLNESYSNNISSEKMTDDEFINELKLFYERKYGIEDDDEFEHFSKNDSEEDSMNKEIPDDKLQGYKFGFSSIVKNNGTNIDGDRITLGVKSYSYLSQKYFDKDIKDHLKLECENGIINSSYNKEEKRIFSEGLVNHYKNSSDDFKEYYFHGIIEGIFFIKGKIDDNVSIIKSKENFGLKEHDVFFENMRDYIQLF